MKKIALLVLLVSLSRGAYAVPTGCFKMDYMTSCYFGYFSPSDCDQYNMSYISFGSYINSMCSYVNSVESENATYVSALTNVLAQRDGANARQATTEQERDQWEAYAGSRDKLIKKLRKACGSKCKRIK